MERISILPKSKEEWLQLRKNDITSTEISALFDISPYQTLFELWHQKKSGTVVRLEENERMFWGTRLQASIAEGIAEQNKWVVQPMNEYIRIPERKIGSSFDFKIVGIAGISDSEVHDIPTILEIKNVDSLVFKQNWNSDELGNYEAPLHIEIQIQHQLAVSGYQEAVLGVMVGGNKLVLIKRIRQENVIEAIFKKVDEFWRTIEMNWEPKPDFSRDAETISRLYGYAEPGKVLDSRGDAQISMLMESYRAAGKDEKEAKERKEAAKAELLTLIGDHEKVLGDSFTLSAGIIPEAQMAFTRKSYRAFKPSWKKTKEDVSE